MLEKPTNLRVTWESAAAPHAYFKRLSSRPDCVAAYPLRSQREIESYPEAASASTVRQPIIYDARHDAAWIRINPPVSSDVKGRFLQAKINSGSFLIAWEFRYDVSFRYGGEGWIKRHKTWRFNPGPWLAVRTDYQHAANVGEFVEVIVSCPAARFLSPNAWRGQPKKPGGHWYGEGLAPRVGEFFLRPNAWTRAWMFFEGMDQPECRMSMWVSDETRDPVQLYDRVPHLTNRAEGGLGNFQIEYDTSGDQAPNGIPCEAWNRNVLILKDLSLDDARKLLERVKAS